MNAPSCDALQLKPSATRRGATKPTCGAVVVYRITAPYVTLHACWNHLAAVTRHVADTEPATVERIST